LAARRTRHLGIDLFAAAGTRVHAPLPGEVAAAQVCAGRLDYGGLVVLRHRTTDGEEFGTLYGHLDPDSIAALRPGQGIAAGTTFATVGAPPANGDWPPHVHVQLLADALAATPAVPPGVADPDEFDAVAALYPDPSLLLRLSAAASWRGAANGDLLARRRARFAGNLALAYRQPLQLVRGHGHFVYDAEGRRYLDAYNNVPHVGHCHPDVVAAVHEQSALLATNTRYLCAMLGAYADALLQRLPAPLAKCFLVASGSEANELALRLCRAHTGRRDLLVMDHGYHGHTTGAMDVSPYKFAGPRGGGAPDWVHVTPQPDPYRGPYRRDDPQAGLKYARLVRARIEALAARGRTVAGYLSECLPSVGGQHVLPDGFLAEVYADVRRAGGVCIADDVQTALGRTGCCFSGFELQGVVPDVLVLGKPLGNGYPIGAVVTTAAIAESFAAGPEFFSTFGGNTVACAAGLAVLAVLDRERLQQQAARVGDRLLAGLQALAREHALIGDVRGTGLFLGVELVADRGTRQPAPVQAAYVKDRLRERRVLLGTEGPFDNVLKIRPPMTFDADAADALLAGLDATLREDGANPGLI
jgi:4-aminobutyrate aminotransferase-like enzyme